MARRPALGAQTSEQLGWRRLAWPDLRRVQAAAGIGTLILSIMTCETLTVAFYRWRLVALDRAVELARHRMLERRR